MFCNISIYYKLIKLFNATPKDLAQSSLHRIFKKKTRNFNQLCPLHFGNLFAVLDKVQTVKNLFKDFLS